MNVDLGCGGRGRGMEVAEEERVMRLEVVAEEKGFHGYALVVVRVRVESGKEGGAGIYSGLWDEIWTWLSVWEKVVQKGLTFV